MKQKKDEATMLLMKHLYGCAFDFCYDAFDKDRQFTEEERDYGQVRQAFVDKFGRKDRPQDELRKKPKAKVHQQELLNSLKKILACLNRKMDRQTRFSLLKNQLRGYESFAQLVIPPAPVIIHVH